MSSDIRQMFVARQRVLMTIALLLGLLVGGAAVWLLRTPATAAPDEASVRSIVAEMIAARPAPAAMPMDVPAIDAAAIGPAVEDYLLANPRVLQRVSQALDRELRTAQAEATRTAIAANREAIFDDPDQIVVGNPDGDVTLVELFDYNCGYCRGALPDLAMLIAEDPNLRVVLKEFPILSAESVDAARVAILVADQKADYWSFHQKLFTSRGQVSGQTALDAAKAMGLNPVTLQLDMQSPRVTAVIQKSYDLAKALNITGTPTYIVGDKLIPGAVPIEQLRQAIANVRACGSATCETPG